MSLEPWHKHVREMIADADRVREFIGGATKAEFIHDQRTIFAVCYAFARMGEAVSHIPLDVQARNPTVPWREVRQFRNFVIHVYLAVDPARLYDTAKSDLPSLAAALRAVLEDDRP